MTEARLYRVRLTSKGQVVIPKALRDKYRLKEGSLLRIIADDEKMILMPETGAPFRDLRGLMRNEWNRRNLDELILEAKRSLFKVQ
jgi:AbrB family looped-hinge helix DNA binding protein